MGFFGTGVFLGMGVYGRGLAFCFFASCLSLGFSATLA